MCNCNVIDRVRAECRSRRNFFSRSASAAAAALAAGLASARQSLGQSRGEVVDLTHAYDHAFPTFDGHPGIEARKVAEFQRDGFTAFQLLIEEHTGTHVDAPLHFTEAGLSIDQVPAQGLVCPLCIVDISAKAKDDPNASVSASDIEAWTSRNGAIPKGACVAMHSGWAKKLGDPSFRNGADGERAFPGFSREAAEMLADMDVAAIGVDTLSLDTGNSHDFGAHRAWLPAGRYGIENLANLDRLPVRGATIFVGAPKHAGGSGGPARVLALL